MNSKVSALWAKKTENHGKLYWLPLIIHLEDTMNVAGWLYNHWLADGQRKYLIENIKDADDEEVLNLVRFLGAIHDIGKATPAFQTQKSFHSSEDLDRAILENLETNGFTGISELRLASPKKSHHTIAGEEILHQLGLNYDITSIIDAHHGKPTNEMEDYDMQEAYPANYYQSENPSSEIALNWKTVQREIYEWALQKSGMDEYEFPEISEPAQVLLSALIIMADWIASNERYFPLIELKTNLNENLNIDERFQEGMMKWFHNLPFDDLDQPDDVYKLYEKRFGFTPKPFQSLIFEAAKNVKEPGIMIIEAPMGSGKTEAALTTAELFAAKSQRSGLFFGLPTQATSNGIFHRIVKWTESLSEDYGNTSIRLVHGKASLNKEMQKLRNYTASNVDMDEDGGTVTINEWFSGRKTTALDDFVVGTVDQFLLMAIKQKHVMLRHLGFSRKVLVIDEVHAYDVYMQQYLQEALKWAGAYHVPVILLSATLPAHTRLSLFDAYMKGKGLKKKELSQFDEILTTTQYPLITYSDGLEIRQKNNLPINEFKTIRIVSLEEENLFRQLEMLTKNGGIVGVIVNTVRRAQMIASQCAELFGQESVELIHASFIAADRISKEEEIMNMIGKNAKRPKMKIIIGTQVLEQSLDIDFDVLITDLCPVDLLVQRMGRLHRHNITRPSDHQIPVTYILGQSDTFDFEEGSVSVYGGYLLARTQMCLGHQISLPQDIPDLVSQVYDENDPDLTEPLLSKYQDFKAQAISERNEKTARAQPYCLDDPDIKINPKSYNLVGWLKDTVSLDNEEKAYAQVRDTKETVEVIAVKKYQNGYSTFDQEEDLSAHIDEFETGQLLANQTLRLPTVFTSYGQIDQVISELEKYNLVNLHSWQNNQWLKGSLGIIFDENDSFRLRGKLLKYDTFLGLRIEEGDE